MSTATAIPRRWPLVIFDWDGTLMDSIGSIEACTRAAFDAIDLPAPPGATIRGAVGLGLDQVFVHIMPTASERDQQRLVEAYRDLWIGTYRHHVALFDGVREALTRLATAGHLLAVATGKGRVGLDRDLSVTGLDRRFHATRTVDEARSKPDPQMLLDLLDTLGVRAEDALMVGDTTFDLQAASNARMASVAVLTGAHPAAQLKSLRPEVTLPSAAALPDWLASLT